MKQRLLFIVSLFIAWLPVFAIQKPVFMLYNSTLENACSPINYLKVIAHGLLLDCTVSGYLTALPLLLTILTVWFPGKWFKAFLKGYFITMAILISAIFCVDIALYPYWGFRLDSTLFFYLQSPKDAMASVPMFTLIVQILAFAVYAVAIYQFMKRTVLKLAPVSTCNKRILSSLLLIISGGIMFIPIRGGVTTSTANVGMVYFSDNQFLNHSAINPCFSLMTSLSKQQDFAEQFNFYPEEEREKIFKSIYSKPDSCKNSPCKKEILNTKRPNVLLIILESFSANTIEALGGEKDITPNLNRLCKESVVFSNAYANSFRTDRGTVAILNGYLAQPTTSIMKYPAKSQTLPSIAKSLGEAGYTSDMLYGGDINFTNMQSYFFSSGYSKITSDKDFPITSRLNKWGANDDITFKHLYEEIKSRENEESPWFTTFLTLSSHEPFEVPFHKFEDKYLNSVAFTDSCLGNFIDKIRLSPVWDDMLVILVADHGYKYPYSTQEFEPGRYHIPVIWTGGAIKNAEVFDMFCNQTDIAATLLGQMDIQHKKFRFSKDLLSCHGKDFSFYTFINGFGFMNSDGYTVFDNEGNKTLIESGDSEEQSEERLKSGKALLQTLYDDMGRR